MQGMDGIPLTGLYFLSQGADLGHAQRHMSESFYVCSVSSVKM